MQAEKARSEKHRFLVQKGHTKELLQAAIFQDKFPCFFTNILSQTFPIFSDLLVDKKGAFEEGF